MLPLNTNIVFRTCGRGVLRTWKGTIKHIVKAGSLPKPNALQAAVPHGDKPSNRDRYIVALKTGKLMWANAATCVEAGAKLPPHNPRLGQHQEKVKAKVKAKVAPTRKRKVKKSGFVGPDAGLPPLVAKMTKTGVKVEVKRKGGDKPKTTWYGIVDGKIVSVRKGLCPAGFYHDKARLVMPTTEPTPAPATPFQSEPTQATPAAASLPQASL